jgi:hypothetical protein
MRYLNTFSLLPHHRAAAALVLLVFGSANTIAAAATDFGQWAATPPMGWNSWDVYGSSVTEAEVKANADYMAKNLKPLRALIRTTSQTPS